MLAEADHALWTRSSSTGICRPAEIGRSGADRGSEQVVRTSELVGKRLLTLNFASDNLNDNTSTICSLDVGKYVLSAVSMQFRTYFEQFGLLWRFKGSSDAKILCWAVISKVGSAYNAKYAKYRLLHILHILHINCIF